MSYRKSIALFSASLLPVVKAKHVQSPGNDTLKLKPSEIPLYSDIDEFYSIECYQEAPGKLEEGASVIRGELESVIAQTKEVRDKIVHIYETGKAHSLNTKAYLQDEDNVGARIGAITYGALVGLLFATKKGYFKKLLYTSIGGGAVASACYPDQAVAFSKDIVKNAELYANIGYNFLQGAKPNEKTESVSTKTSVPKEESPEKSSAPISKVRGMDHLEKFSEDSSDVTVWGFRLRS